MSKPRKIRVVHLTSVHSNEDARIFHKECRTLSESGYEVTLLSADSNKTTNFGIIKRNVAFPRSRSERMSITLFNLLRMALKENADIYHFHDSELIPLGLLLKMVGKKVIYDVHEDLPTQILYKPWLIPGVRKVVSKMADLIENNGSKIFDHCIAATPTIAERFRPDKTTLVRNFPVLSEFESTDRSPYQERPLNIACIGSIAAIRGIHEILESFDLIENEAAELYLAGHFSSQRLETELNLNQRGPRIKYEGLLDRRGVDRLLAKSRVGLVILHPTKNYLDSLPVKLFEYMAAGVPVVAADFPLWRDIITEAKCGVLVDPLRPQKIAEGVDWILSHPEEARKMGEAGRKATCESFNWFSEGKALVDTYDRISRLL